MRLIKTLFTVSAVLLVFASSRGALPDLAPIGLQFPSAITTIPYPQITVSWSVTNQGDAEVFANWADGGYVSTDTNGTGFSASFVAWPYSGPFAPGDTYYASYLFPIPVAESGDYYLIFRTDFFNYVTESN